MNNKHTPGPWRADNGDDGSGIPGWNIFGDRVSICSMGDYTEYHKEINPHNARLIAAAPDLLAACEAVDKMLAGPAAMFDLNGMRNILRPAIAKARGKS